MVVGIHSCEVSSRNSALRDYTNSVSSLQQQSVSDGQTLFKQLATPGASANPTALRTQIDTDGFDAQKRLDQAQGLSVPDQVSSAQQHFLDVLRLRLNGFQTIAANIDQALGTASKDGLAAVATGMADFYASDVVYKQFVAKQIAEALNAAGISVGGANSEQINGAQFVTNIGWLTPSYIAAQIGAQAPATTGGRLAPGLHGDKIDSVAVGATTLSTSSTNAIPASPAPTFTLSFTNDGQNPETGTGCLVTVSGTSITGHGVVAQTTAGQTTTCTVKLSSAPPTGQYTVVARIEKVPGEHNLTNNVLSFPVTFT